jgi:hypothetical protein
MSQAKTKLPLPPPFERRTQILFLRLFFSIDQINIQINSKPKERGFDNKEITIKFKKK